MDLSDWNLPEIPLPDKPRSGPPEQPSVLAPKTAETHYQVLGVQPNASTAIIDAAYQRLSRLYQLNSDQPWNAFPAAAQTDGERRLQRIVDAHRVLRDPVRRLRYDQTLRANGKSHQDQLLSPQPLREEGVWLSEQRHEDGEVIFRIGWAADFAAVRAALTERIPKSDCNYDETTGLWRVSAVYSPLLADIFENFEPPIAPAPARAGAPVYERREPSPGPRGPGEAWNGWPLLLVGGLAFAIVLTLLFPSRDRAAEQAAATATARVLALEVVAVEEALPTPLPSTDSLLELNASPLYPSVYLRARPSTDAASVDYLAGTQQYAVLGRTSDSSWLVVRTEKAVGWSAAWTLEIDGNAEELAVFQPNDPLPTPLPTSDPDPPAETP